MAYAESAGMAGGYLSVDSTYKLGEYTFSIKVNDTESACNIIATVVDGKNNKTAIYSRAEPAGTTVKGWNVSCDETTATVYATIVKPYSAELKSGSPSAVAGDTYCTYIWGGERVFTSANATRPVLAGWCKSTGTWECIPILCDTQNDVTHTFGRFNHIMTLTVNDITFWLNDGVAADPTSGTPTGTYLGDFAETGYEGLILKYFKFSDNEIEQSMVGRFFINIADADGTNEPSDEETGDAGGYNDDWIEPDDAYYDEESTEPSTTLYLTVHGARSGRHNDPIKDDSYSYIPDANDAEAFYGCGGAGGHGGGGGAGASTVIVKKFSTSKANSHDVTAIAQSHGYGSGGGAGASGGDGCILIYY